MQTSENVLPMRLRHLQTMWSYALDSFLASVGMLLVTGVISIFHLYPRIPNISIVYLPVVLILAVRRGRYAAILASFVAFLSFDYFIVPPLYTFVMYHVEEWISLFVFLINAVLTSHLASSLCVQARRAERQERETHILYDLMRETTREEGLHKQLQIVAQTLVKVFSAWGIYDCALLQMAGDGTLQMQAGTSQSGEAVTLSADEQKMAGKVLTQGHSIRLRQETLPAPARPAFKLSTWMSGTVIQQTVRRSICLLPLKVGSRVVGVLRLGVQENDPQSRLEESLQAEQEHPQAHTAFFWTFLDQAATLIERAWLRNEHMRMELLQRTDELRSALLSSVSHDLRTPLTVIKAATSSLLQDDIEWGPQERRSFICSIEREADRLNHLVGNLLDMSRIENGALQPDKDWYNVNSLIADVVNRLQPMFKEREVRLALPSEIALVELDYLQIDQVLTNLIENALRYTPAGSPIDIGVEWEEHAVTIYVADRGPGIQKEDRERIFDKFYRVLSAKPTSGDTPAGSGLGLAVCKGLVEAHGGHIWVKPRNEGGVIFYVRLPRETYEGSEL
ncbi:ATP-binding protein [Dictyobacter kobayashii]|uniref:histidine kinase n=1 Tax=Dictyobacter kobayashii TaxID=2014872 RepID=A0A402ABR1_9CHLR|nr:ATP-binding protein [Dictyobacter kobayashii]GCE16539.1 hypothetical protein KDK_03390 [Dictyobacter kobayashii]